MATSQDFVNWVCSDALIPEFLMYAILAEGDGIARFGRGTTHTTIYFPEVKALHICLPSLASQRRIVELVKRSLETLDVVTAQATEALVGLDRLKDAVLARTVRGELTPAAQRRDTRAGEPATTGKQTDLPTNSKARRGPARGA